MQLFQATSDTGERQVIVTEGAPNRGRILDGIDSVYELALGATERGVTLHEWVTDWPGITRVDVATLAEQGRLLSPIDHPDPAHLLVTGTGLTHLGSAEGRDRMHRRLDDAATLTDSMKMFRKGLEGGKPAPGVSGVQPEWFYKGDGSIVAAPGAALSMPSYALDGGEEPEIAGIYVIDNRGMPCRLGFVLGNEFSDHVTERENYLYLAHSKLRACAFGPALRLGALPEDVRGVSRIRRNDVVLWEKPFLSGEANMCHSIANLEAHHFKYAQFRRPGDIHVHFFGTATLSFSDDVRAQPGDVFEIEADGFGPALRNSLAEMQQTTLIVREL